MNRSWVMRVLVATVALAAVVTGAGAGLAASRALTRALTDAGQSVSEFNPDDTREPRKK
jgi:ribosomal protein S12 methylthiotransferase accessory factor YcaO